MKRLFKKPRKFCMSEMPEIWAFRKLNLTVQLTSV